MSTKSVNNPKPAPKEAQQIAAESGEEGHKVTRNTSNSRKEIRQQTKPQQQQPGR